MTQPGSATPLYTTTASAHGGRAGHVDSEDGQLNVRLAVPSELGGDGGAGSTPEQLFAAALAASFESAMGAVARAERYPEFGVMRVQATVGLRADGDAHDLTAALDITLPGLMQDRAQHLVDRGQDLCAFSRALKGKIEYRLHRA
ncbi:Ohr family peroxiredoxin [Deinococcus radiopugnans]|uniref:Ohr family peroxiredoxin n=1 Tax=Deinococcus radiopugnans ATCC 19172 TaxID=585398 RepID=A0A5C4YC68_9DEIO|nr:Ohr family peroxiredoxin [Deinococcus radiopugnans]MBB6015175.1 Ohr subfamily peroxiredoxin [Deinococcus radiopugnans ATCC 19172]QLG13065.1 Ohr family peroxiredoxin [Deinococcus sp. D7000]TNM73117.1 Ohr family peroxiredoxin [Deinococcus radiopugnans ATCC 19172]